ncbi:MAG: CPBP family intramembrane metalloprotease [Anaerolineales bacterium]|nr:CPBP family intramembrane metalloprotease [Anaerolineales bacterium]
MNESKSHRQVAWLIIALLLFLRIPFTIAITFFHPIEDHSGGVVYEVGTYLLTAILIYWERHRLADFHVDVYALAFIIFLRPLQTLILAYWKVDSPMAFPHPVGLLIWVISIGSILLLWQSRFKPARASFITVGWLAIGIFAGICVSVAGNLNSFRSMFSPNPYPPSVSVLTSMSLNIVYHLGFAPINEEPLFRGFLWGYLRQLKWKDGWIMIFQALLFTCAHVYFAGRYPLMFWVYIPATAILFGWLTLRSRSITPAILAHGMINGSVYVLIMVSLRAV